MLYAGSRGYLDQLNSTQIDHFMRTASLDLVDYDWLFIETILALKDFDGEAEESMKAYIDQVAFVQTL
jgi:F0F1-type ATP synthase alpha subunit